MTYTVQENTRLQARAVNDLHVNGKLAAIVVENKSTDTASARLESICQTGPQVGLVNDGQCLLDVTRLRHGNNVTVLHVQNTVLLEDGTQHGLDDNTGGRVRHKGRLFMQLLGEEINTEVSVLASGRRGGDADDLARSALQHQEVAEADVVARDGDSVGNIGATRLARAAVCHSNLFLDVHIDLIMVMVVVRVSNLVSKLVDALAEGVVVAWWRSKHGKLAHLVTYFALLVQSFQKRCGPSDVPSSS